MNAPDRIRATWYASDDDAMPKTVSALTPASRFWDTDPHLVEYIRADLTRAPLAEALAVPEVVRVVAAFKELLTDAEEIMNVPAECYAALRAIGERVDG